ncbi:MAG: hypothetical protein M3R44_07775, partial [Candidatus Eremiobacteraeota bacterium]|nr:hypothetical protein [Candidatus Eremiobacteraeota bacterium]
LDTEGMPLALTALDQPLELEARATTVRLEPYETAVVPAALDVVMVRGPKGGATALVAGPIDDPEAVPKRFARAAVDVNESTAFLAQF